MEELNLKRYIFNAEHGDDPARNIIGDLLIDKKYFCYTLEDELRADGIKKYGVTAIPAGKYFVTLTYSPKFKRDLPLIYNKKDDKGNYWIEGKLGKTKWTGVRFHGGKNEDHSLGCPLIGYWTDGRTINKSATNQLVPKFVKGEHYPLLIENVPLSYEGNFKG